jgi:hypothetical protein
VKKNRRAAVREFSLALMACIASPAAVFLQNSDLLGENRGFGEVSGRWEGVDRLLALSGLFAPPR